jgi:DNA-binding GntR family transcriptional regulator
MEKLYLDVDKRSAVPLYLQVAEQIENAIRDGILAPGDRLDNEIALSRQFGLSRATMRNVMAELVGKGLIVRRRGIGTQVVGGQPLVEHLPGDTRTTVLTNELIPASVEVAAELMVRPGTRVLHLRRLRFLDDEPLAILENHLPGDLSDVGDLNLTGQALHHLLHTQGVNLRVTAQKIRARTGTPEECQRLGDPDGAPLLTIEHTAYDDSGRPVEWATDAYRAGRYSYELTLVDRRQH